MIPFWFLLRIIKSKKILLAGHENLWLVWIPVVPVYTGSALVHRVNGFWIRVRTQSLYPFQSYECFGMVLIHLVKVKWVSDSWSNCRDKMASCPERLCNATLSWKDQNGKYLGGMFVSIRTKPCQFKSISSHKML